VQTQDAQCPARGAQRFLQQAQQAPEIQWLQQAPAEADRCVVHIGARPFGSAYEHHGGKFRRHKSSWRARARWEDRKYDSNGPALGTACATAVAALTTEEAILRHSVRAKDAKEAFERLSREDKQRLLIFLKSL
jgi:Di-haem oxidoreductase, putative peroxidase